ncbi:hypothetical protein [Streptomyces roseirectus]|uniref:hypothetical protein n=1 Tax=Streptomyces roseirectus TaxID=2768066 RepID=UPI001FE69F60|nr:hypothetical protein [Streptomyces roseirectus]
MSTSSEGVLERGGTDAGVLVLAGSSGRIEHERVRLLAGHGMTALSIRWFGGAGQPSELCEVPLETFTRAIDPLLAQGVRRIGVLGTSKGAEAALLTAAHAPLRAGSAPPRPAESRRRTAHATWRNAVDAPSTPPRSPGLAVHAPR